MLIKTGGGGYGGGGYGGGRLSSECFLLQLELDFFNIMY